MTELVNAKNTLKENLEQMKEKCDAGDAEIAKLNGKTFSLGIFSVFDSIWG